MAKNLLAICLVFMVASSVVYEVQGTFLLKLYLMRRFPRRCMAFAPFAAKGMLMLVRNLEGGCPATREFKEFFTRFRSYVSFISSASSSSRNVESEMNGRCELLAKAMSALSGSKSEQSSELKNTMLSMGKTLVDQKRQGSKIMTMKQRKELVISMVRWTRVVVTTIKSVAEKRGKSIDESSYGLDVDVNKSIGSRSESGGSSSSDSDSSSNTRSQGWSSKSGSASNTEAGSTETGSSTKTGSFGRSGSDSSKTKESRAESSGNTYKDTTGSTSDSPSGSPTTSHSSSTSADDKTSEKGSASSSGSASMRREYKSGSATSGSVSSKTKESSSGSSGNTYKDTTGTTSDSPRRSPTGSPSGSTSTGGETSVQESASARGNASERGSGSESDSGSASSQKKESNRKSSSSSSSSTSVKEVESQTSSEVESFISNLEKKYTGHAELKVFFDKLKTSMTASSKLSSSNKQDFVSGMKSAATKLSEAMMFVRSRFSKSEETKNSMENSQEQVMKTLKELQDINSQIVSGKKVSTTQQTELKQTITKWEQVTTQFVETAASSSSSSSLSSSSSQQQGNARMAQNN